MPPMAMGAEFPMLAGDGLPEPTPEELALMGQAVDALAASEYLTPEAQALNAEAEAQQAATDEEERRKMMRAMYGSDFPLATETPEDEAAWVRWAGGRWDAHRPGVQDALWISERNRLFYNDIQWISANGYRGQWREPPMPKDAVRAVVNLIKPATNWALQVMSEQRPGWRFTPSTNDPDRQKKAQAQQLAVEYQWHRQKMRAVLREAGYWAKQDGVSFLMTYWDPDEGPWDESMRAPLGDVMTRVYRIEQVRVSADASATRRPKYWVCRDVMPLQEAVNRYGPEVADEGDAQYLTEQQTTFAWQTYQTAPLLSEQKTVDRIAVAVERSSVLPEGLMLVCVGKKVVLGPMPLMIQRAPMVRFADGSPDPKFYPDPEMNQLIGPQMRVNMLVSKWLESVRKNAGGRFIAQSGALVTETFTGGQSSVIEVRTTGNVADAIQPVPGMSIGTDVKELLEVEIKKIETLTGWTEESRGQFSSDQSGRAILAIREQLERTFAPFVGAAAEAMTEWAEQQVLWMKWGYQVPRMIGTVGQNRPDLARALSADDLDGTVDVQVDTETLMPMPRALRLWLLKDSFEIGAIDAREYRRRLPFAHFEDMGTPDDVQEARAQRIAEQLKNREDPGPVFYQDDEAIHQTVLERELILAADTDPDVLDAAMFRWQELALQAQMKMGAMMPPTDPAQAGSAPAGAPVSEGLSPLEQPFVGNAPGIAAAPAAMLQGQPPATGIPVA